MEKLVVFFLHEVVQLSIKINYVIATHDSVAAAEDVRVWVDGADLDEGGYSGNDGIELDGIRELSRFPDDGIRLDRTVGLGRFKGRSKGLLTFCENWQC